MPALRETLQRTLADSYTLDREIGRGGMATVYLARDRKHGRNVALKVLDPELGAVLGAERFLAEIRTTASLQHPNLLPLFDSGEAGGLLYYVMPFVEGETLRGRLEREKQLPVAEATRIASAIAEALDYAHGHGVIHRDLKPENILLQHGQPVVADFGIALAVSNAGGARVTQTGLSLGTPQYMSPEQATGDRVIDARTDVYSLAAMTYEMLTGEPPHSGTSAQAIIAKLMTTEPQRVRVLRPSVPPNVAMAVEQGLAKLPADRFATAREFAAALADPGFRTGASEESAGRAARGSARTVTGLAVLSAVSLAAAAWGWLRPAPAAPLQRYAMALDSAEGLVATPRWGRMTLSPDGTMLVYVGGPANALMLRRRDELNARAIPGTENAGAPVFSPDGRRIAFIQRARTIVIASLDGTPPFAVTDSLVGLAGLAWGEDERIYYDGRGAIPMLRVAPRAGAAPERFATLDTAARETDQDFPEALPGGKGILYVTSRVSAGSLGTAIAWMDPETGTSRVLVRDASRVRYAHSGHLLYTTSDGNLMAVRFDPRAGKVDSMPVLVAQGLPQLLQYIDFAVSRSGRLAYIAGPGGEDLRTMVWVDRGGRVTEVDSTWRGMFVDPALSPDGSTLAVSTGAGAGSGDIWIRRLATGATFKLSVEGGINRNPVFTRDGRRVFYTTVVGDSTAIVEKPVDGSAAARTHFRVGWRVFHLALTPDERAVLYTSGGDAAGRVLVRRLDDTVATPMFPDEPLARTPAFSPDGRWLAYAVLSLTGAPAIYVAPYPNPTGAKWLVTPEGGNDPQWARGGTELLYRVTAQRTFSTFATVPVSTRPTFSFGRPTMLFPGTDYPSRPAVAQDGARVLLVRRIGTSSRERLTIVENWTAALGATGAAPAP